MGDQKERDLRWLLSETSENQARPLKNHSTLPDQYRSLFLQSGSGLRTDQRYRIAGAYIEE